MSRLKGNTDLGVTFPTVPSQGGAQCSVSAGLPSFAGRNPGDQHYDSNAGKEYVLTGKAGTSVVEDFNRFVDGTDLIGQATQTGGLTYLALGTTSHPIIRSGMADGLVGNSGVALVNLGSSGAQSVSMDCIVGGDTANQSFNLYLRAAVDLSSSINIIYYPGNILIYRRGTQVQLAGYTFTGDTVGQPQHVSASIDANGVITTTVNGTTLGTCTDNTLTGTYAAFGIPGVSASTYALNQGDNFSASLNGSLAWTRSDLGPKEVSQVAASGATQTLPSPQANPITRIVLTANCTITMPTIVVGQELKVTLVQDSTGGRTVTWDSLIKWPGGTAPTMTATALKGDAYSFYADGSGNWIGNVVGQNY